MANGNLLIGSPDVARVGVGVFIFKERRFLMGQRRGAHGEGAWSVPGGHPEFGESFEQTAVRETEEETGLRVTNVRFGAVTNDVFPDERKHYATIWMLSDYLSGEETVVEPDKYVRLGWYDFTDLPRPLFLPWRQLLSSPFIHGIRHELDSREENPIALPDAAPR